MLCFRVRTATAMHHWPTDLWRVMWIQKTLTNLHKHLSISKVCTEWTRNYYRENPQLFPMEKKLRFFMIFAKFFFSVLGVVLNEFSIDFDKQDIFGISKISTRRKKYFFDFQRCWCSKNRASCTSCEFSQMFQRRIFLELWESHYNMKIWEHNPHTML